MPRNPHYYIRATLRGMVAETLDAVLNTEYDFPSNMVEDLAAELEGLVVILDDIRDHLIDDENEPSNDYDPQQDLNYYAGLEL